MHYAYLITNNVNQKVYVGITINPKERWLRHQSNARNDSSVRGKRTYLYNAMRKHGIENFSFEVVKEFEDKTECSNYEINTISFFRENVIPNYNLHDGGTIGFAMTPDSPKYAEWKQKQSDFMTTQKEQDSETFAAWKDKLSIARKGRTPSLGMKHTDENKQLASEVSNKYWDTQETFTRDSEKVKAILALSHREAKKTFGISTTHYYRLKKRFANNDSE